MNPYPFTGLTTKEVQTSRNQHGAHIVDEKANHPIWDIFKKTVFEPMFLLLLACTIIYFSLGELSEGWFMLGAIVLVSAISFYQENTTRKALEALKEFTQAHAHVIRNNEIVQITSDEIVIGDYLVVSEGELIQADGIIKQLNDFTVNESILTGESFAIEKVIDSDDNSSVFQGTLVVSGQCVFEVKQIGSQTKLGQIGTSVDAISIQKTPLEKQINSFVTWMAIIGSSIFLLIWIYTYYQTGDLLNSLLKGLTIAMSVLPEEIPVAFATFMALGAWRLMKVGIIVKQTQTVEALGSATVLCTDKTGTITQNRMSLSTLYAFKSNTVYNSESFNLEDAQVVISTSMWASESVPFDTMEIAIHDAYKHSTKEDVRKAYSMIHEYPLGGNPPMMTHVFENAAGDRIVACKGAPEALLKYSVLAEDEKKNILKQLADFASKGIRVLGVGRARIEGADFPKQQELISFEFLGLIGFIDPPKENISTVFEKLYNAGIEIKIITGDNALTTAAIAKQADFKGYDNGINSDALLALSDTEFDSAVCKYSIFTRMYPELKLRIVERLKAQGYIVGMTGDGVNDGPALKAANIGIAMGKRGSEIAKEASSLILTDDDFGKMVDAVAMGRRIYTNLKKAIQYIISIHIPIILTVAAPLLLGWIYPEIFTPVHVIFLELIMGPTCSIVYENEPMEKNSMNVPPRQLGKTFLNINELLISIVQGLVITIGTLSMYQYSTSQGNNEEITRSMVFATLVCSNIILSLVNRSLHYSIFRTLFYKNRLMVFILVATFILLCVLLYVPIVSAFFKLGSLSIGQLCISVIVAILSVLWFELYKWYKRVK
ncbi:cation-translocating P-type ATPase [Cytophaga aurantiaca]|uniref:cation-translocating P-type ATPase n=1 Tax=Cytophaga aurantiaca TaxID=29530 RepID=UPI00035CE6EF|nr:cation-translocating P-type ATPase [Cytophaga aurantiaca]